MNKRGQTIKSFLALLTLVSLTSCATAGEPITQQKVNEIRAGQTTEADLVRAFGLPTTRIVDLKGEALLDWFYSSPPSVQTFIPIIGPVFGMNVEVWQLSVLLSANGEVKRYIAYSNFVTGRAGPESEASLKRVNDTLN